MPQNWGDFFRKTILVIDDVEINRGIVKKIFGDKYNVLAAENGKIAMQIMSQHNIDLVLLDIQMPVMNGYEVIQAMKEDEDFAAIPIIVTTGAIDKSERRALDLGADDFITQPYDPYIMKRRAENLIERYELRGLRDVAKEQQRSRTLINILGIAYWEWTATGGYYYSNEYKNYAISEIDNEKIWDGVTPFEYVYPEDVSLMEEFMQKYPNNEIRKSAVVRCKMRDGTYRWTEMLSISETSQDGKLERLVSVMRDVNKEWIEQKEQLEKALKEAKVANIAKTAFMSRISHDMRTPLNGILGLTTLLKEDMIDDKVKHDLSELELSGRYLLNLINDTLDVSRIESGKLELHPIICDGRDLFNNAIGLAKTNIQTKHIQLNVNAEEIPYTMLYVDVARIEQVIMNVVGNAIKFTPENGNIDITITNLSIENNVITNQLVIKDNGIGMSKEFLPHIFEAFAQEDVSRTSNYQGTGLGMAITKQLLQRMGGDISVESELGKGSSFTIILKLDVATDEQVEKWKKSRISNDHGLDLYGKRILLCEDHPLNTTIATRLLEARHMIVEHAENGQIGVEMFAHSISNYYDAILMDIRMPVMDGIEATKVIRGLSRRDARIIPIIAMTANAFADDVQQTKDAGMDAHLSKPIQTEVLYNTLGKVLKVNRDIRRQKILVVDDIEINRAVICTSLEQDYDILEASNGEMALEILKKNRGLDAVITDIQMPEMDGMELIRRIRENDKYRHIVIIANTQFGDPEQEEKLLALGANDFVYKPTTPKIIEIRVRNALKRI